MRPPLTRRRLLALAGAALPVGGCLGSSSDPATGTDRSATTGGSTADADGPLTRRAGESHATAEGWSLTVGNVAVRHGIVQFGTVHPDPRWESGSQFVVADATVEGDGAPDPADLRLYVRTDALDRSDRYFVRAETNEDGRRQRFGFPVPTDPAPARAWVVWRPEEGPAVRWSLDEGSVRALGSAPEFVVESFETPSTAVPDDEFEATLGVRNEGERDGTFLAEVGNAAVSDQPEVELDVPAGGTTTGTASVDAYFGDRREMEVVLRWEDGTERRTVRRA
ncbi:MAG: hypothetical protein ABEH47_06960 [Haloferacaceae archaeon]